MPASYLRKYRLTATSIASATVGSVKTIEDLRVKFKIGKTSQSSPNKSTIEIYNLNPSSRAFFEKTEDKKDVGKFLQVNLEAGYEGSFQTIFTGNVVNSTVTRSPPDVVVKLECGDGQKAMDFTHGDKTFSKGTPVQALLTDLISLFQVSVPLSVNKASKIPVLITPAILQAGLTVSGSPADVLDDFARSFGFDWSIQDGQAVITMDNEVTLDVAPLISSSTGLINAIEPTDDGVKFKTLLNPAIRPGSAVATKDRIGTTNYYKVKTASFIGDTHGAPW
jgi:hypothetical protein